MAMTRIWLGPRLGVTELPDAIRNAEVYQGKDVFLDEAVRSHNKRWIKLTFEGGAVHYWRQDPTTGEWKFSQNSPTVEDLNDKVAAKTKAFTGENPPDPMDTPGGVPEFGGEG